MSNRRVGVRRRNNVPVGAFVSVWNTTLGNGAPLITLPLIESGNYNFTVSWGDGTTDTITSYDQAEVTHTYAVGGVKTITITGTIEGWSFYNGGECQKITSVTQWGDLRLGNDGGYFMGCTNLDLSSVSDVLNLNGTLNMIHLFNSCNSLTTINRVNEWNVSNVENMSNMFASSQFNQDISSWNVSSVTNMNSMFYDSQFDQPIGNWNVSNVIDMSGMFLGTPFNQDISSWDVSSVTDMNGMFASSKSVVSQFDQPIGNWDVSSVTTMVTMFAGSIFNRDISSWNVSGVTDMEGMFAESQFNQPIGNWDVSNVTYMVGMFAGSIFNRDISSWNVSGVTDMQGMFADSQFNQPIGNWNVSSVDDMSSMFARSIFNQPLSGWNVSNVTNMGGMFAESQFNQPIGNWNVSNVTNMEVMFANSPFNQDISSWNVSGVNNMVNFMNGKTTADYSYYDNLLNSWSLLTLQPNVVLDMGTIEYTSAGATARQSIIDNYEWTINDGGEFTATTTTTTEAPTTTTTTTSSVSSLRMNYINELEYNQGNVVEIDEYLTQNLDGSYSGKTKWAEGPGQDGQYAWTINVYFDNSSSTWKVNLIDWVGGLYDEFENIDYTAEIGSTLNGCVRLDTGGNGIAGPRVLDNWNTNTVCFYLETTTTTTTTEAPTTTTTTTEAPTTTTTTTEAQIGGSIATFTFNESTLVSFVPYLADGYVDGNDRTVVWGDENYPLTTNGSGSGAQFQTPNLWTNYSEPDENGNAEPIGYNYGITIILSGGTGYQVGDTLTLLGSYLGGEDGNDNLIFTVTSIG